MENGIRDPVGLDSDFANSGTPVRSLLAYFDKGLISKNVAESTVSYEHIVRTTIARVISSSSNTRMVIKCGFMSPKRSRVP